MLYLKEADSKRRIARAAACSPLEVKPYLVKEAEIAGAARSALTHSCGKGAPAQDAVFASMPMRPDIVRATGTAGVEDGLGV